MQERVPNVALKHIDPGRFGIAKRGDVIAADEMVLFKQVPDQVNTHEARAAGHQKPLL